MSYDNFAQTFSKSRQNHPWPELDYLIDIMCQKGTTSVLDIGCGNGRFLEHYENYQNHSPLSLRDIPPQRGWQIRKGDFVSSPTLWGIHYLGIDSSLGMIEEARSLHPGYSFEVCDMLSLWDHEMLRLWWYDMILLLASFHHLRTRDERLQVLKNIKSYLAPSGEIIMTNWNLSAQPKYEKSHRWNGDYDIKIGEYSRYYHGFTTDELEWLFIEAGYQIMENRVFEGGRNIVSKIKTIQDHKLLININNI